MNEHPADDIAALIDFHAHGHRVPESLEVRRESWRREAQARFDARGLPAAPSDRE